MLEIAGPQRLLETLGVPGFIPCPPCPVPAVSWQAEAACEPCEPARSWSECLQLISEINTLISLGCGFREALWCLPVSDCWGCHLGRGVGTLLGSMHEWLQSKSTPLPALHPEAMPPLSGTCRLSVMWGRIPTSELLPHGFRQSQVWGCCKILHLPWVQSDSTVGKAFALHEAARSNF